MESVFGAIPVGLFAAAVIAYVAIVRDVLPHLPPEHQDALRHVFYNPKLRLSAARGRNEAINAAWQAHAAYFPDSRKRIAFSALLIAAALSLFCYPVWLYFR